MVDLVSNLKRIRTERRLTQDDIATVLSVNQQQYSRYELGINEIPVHHVMKLCKFYGISADWLLGLKETE